MKFACKEVRLLATDNVKSKKGNSYNVGLFQKGVDTIKLMLPDDVNIDELELNQTYDLEVDYNTQYRQLSLLSLG